MSTPESAASFDAIGFRVGQEEYGLPLTVVQEVIHLPRITRVPRALPYVRGVINYHGNIVTIIDLSRRLGVGETAVTPATRVMVVEHKQELIGFLVDRVGKLGRIEGSAIEPAPLVHAGIAGRFLEGVVRMTDHFVIFLHLGALLSDSQAQGETALEE